MTIIVSADRPITLTPTEQAQFRANIGASADPSAAVAVQFIEQGLTTPQQQQARVNINAVGFAELEAALALLEGYDEVDFYDNFAAFPAEGEDGKVYVDKAGNTSYRWSGAAYVSLGVALALASQAEAQAGTDNVKYVSSLRVHQAISAKMAQVGDVGFSSGVTDKALSPYYALVYMQNLGVLRRTMSTAFNIDRTLELADCARHLVCNAYGSVALIIPTNASVAIPTGTIIPVTLMNLGNFTKSSKLMLVGATSSVEIRGKNGWTAAKGNNTTIYLQKRQTDAWVVSGDLCPDAPFDSVNLDNYHFPKCMLSPVQRLTTQFYNPVTPKNLLLGYNSGWMASYDLPYAGAGYEPGNGIIDSGRAAELTESQPVTVQKIYDQARNPTWSPEQLDASKQPGFDYNSAAMTFDGLQQYLEGPNTIPFDFGSGSFTILVRFRLAYPAGVTAPVIISKGSAMGGLGWCLNFYMDESSQYFLQFSVGDGVNPISIIATNAVGIDVWTTVAVGFSYDTGNIFLEQLGVVTRQTAFVGSVVGDSAAPVYLGAGNSGGSPDTFNLFVGAISHVGIWERELSSDDIRYISYGLKDNPQA
jgi:hypothetical protein